jgi:membrane associated rhomboid family serine protease
MQNNRFGGGASGVQVTPLARKVLISLVSLYVAQLVLLRAQGIMGAPSLGTGPRGFIEALYLWPVGSGHWRPWQPLTSLLVNGPTPLAAFFDWLFLFFILGPVETLMGTRRFLRGMGTVVLFAAGMTFLLDGLGLLDVAGLEAAYVGLNPVMVGLLVFFGLAMPNAQIMLFFVLPVKASSVAWVAGLLSLLFFLYTPTLGTAMALFGWVGAYLWSQGKTGTLDRWKLKWRKAKLEKELERFQVLDGGKDDDDWVH